MRRVRLNWQLSEIDKYSIRRTQQIIGEELGSAGLGRLKITLDDRNDTWPSKLSAGYHHMGTTRMHEDPSLGVVDADCRVHGVSNLFIAGSSVFPTVGHANPVLTSTALTLRLADHIKREMS
jgi:choline dehydrogenase-like flavoprotein